MQSRFARRWLSKGAAGPPGPAGQLADNGGHGIVVDDILDRGVASRLAGATSHRSEWAATRYHGTLRRVETNGLAAGAKSSPAMLECVQPRWENMAIRSRSS